jgi:hypothetical protein
MYPLVDERGRRHTASIEMKSLQMNGLVVIWELRFDCETQKMPSAGGDGLFAKGVRFCRFHGVPLQKINFRGPINSNSPARLLLYAPGFHRKKSPKKIQKKIFKFFF